MLWSNLGCRKLCFCHTYISDGSEGIGGSSSFGVFASWIEISDWGSGSRGLVSEPWRLGFFLSLFRDPFRVFFPDGGPWGLKDVRGFEALRFPGE